MNTSPFEPLSKAQTYLRGIWCVVLLLLAGHVYTGRLVPFHVRGPTHQLIVVFNPSAGWSFKTHCSCIINLLVVVVCLWLPVLQAVHFVRGGGVSFPKSGVCTR